MNATTISVSQFAINAFQNSAKDLARTWVEYCAAKYGFDMQEALKEIESREVNINVQTSAQMKPQGKSIKINKKRSFPIPFNSGAIQEDNCQAIVYNDGLFTQCEGDKEEGEYCAKCMKEPQVDGVPVCGNVSRRLSMDLMEYQDLKGRKVKHYTQVLKKKKIEMDNVRRYLEVNNIVVSNEHMEVSQSEKRGRPKKEKKEIVSVSPVSDIFAELAEDIDSESDITSNTESVEEQTSVPTATSQEKKAKKEAAQAEKAEKKAQKEAAEAEKKAKKEAVEAEKAEKKAQKEAAEAEKKAKKEAAEAEKKAKKENNTEEAKKAKKEAVEAEKKAKKEAAEAEKKAQKEAEKNAKKEAAEAEKKAKKDAAEAEKKAKKDAAKSEKKTKKDEPKVEVTKVEEVKPEVVSVEETKVEEVKPEVVVVEEETKKVKVKRIEIDGKKYLKTHDNIVYDEETSEEIGTYDPIENKIIYAEEEEEEEGEEIEEEEYVE